MSDIKDMMIAKHESLWLNGVLERTRHTRWELYKLVDSTNPKNTCYITRDFNGNWSKCGKPRGNSLGVFSYKEPMLTFEDLRRKEIEGFEDNRRFYNERCRFIEVGKNIKEEAA